MNRILFLLSLLVVGTGFAEPALLWDPANPVPKASEIQPIEGARHEVIKEREPERDGYSWLHGVALAWWGDRLYASFGLNSGDENTVTEEAGIVWSEDDGKTWSELEILDPGSEDLAVSHGVFLPTDASLYAFLGAFSGKREDVHMRAYRLDGGSEEWVSLGVVARKNFWPMAEPILMENGNWVMAGFQVGGPDGDSGNPAAVAISDGANLLDWEVVTIPAPEGSRMWGESAVIVDGATLTCLARNHGSQPVVFASTSLDFGRTWEMARETNLPMAASKPYAGTLSTGQRYLICTTTADTGNRRHPLTLAVSNPGEDLFSQIRIVSDTSSVAPESSSDLPRLSYPYATEHEGKLYVGYSNDRGLGKNRNCAELTVIPLNSL